MTTYFSNLFKAADADGNGLLEASELQEHLAIVDKVQDNIKSQMSADSKVELTPELLETYFVKALDSAGNVDHFRSVTLANNNQMIKDLFKSIDTNGDGIIDLDEIKAAESARAIQHKAFISIMEEAQKGHPEGLTEDVFC